MPRRRGGGGWRRRWPLRRAAGTVVKPFARLRFELLPDVMGALDERNVVCTFACREPCDSRVAVTRPFVVWRCKLVDTEDARASFRQLIKRRAPERTEADNDNVK